MARDLQVAERDAQSGVSGPKGQALVQEECCVSSHRGGGPRPHVLGSAPVPTPPKIASVSPAVSKGRLSVARWSLCLWVEGRGPPLVVAHPKDRASGLCPEGQRV